MFRIVLVIIIHSTEVDDNRKFTAYLLTKTCLNSNAKLILLEPEQKSGSDQITSDEEPRIKCAGKINTNRKVSRRTYDIKQNTARIAC